ncbi:MAG: TOBE domain-containing protein, partial [Clostridia bacterium]|nr:TOBE domain-containing protein [Clostridia bacterium]
DPMEPVNVVIRPEDINVVEATEDTINGVVRRVTFKGVHYEIIVEACSVDWTIHSTKAPEVGSVVGITFTPQDIHIMHRFEDDVRAGADIVHRVGTAEESAQ